MDQMYNVVAGVEHYTKFVPWCVGSSVIETGPRHSKAKLQIGFPPLVESYTSHLTLSRPNLVRVCFENIIMCFCHRIKLS